MRGYGRGNEYRLYLLVADKLLGRPSHLATLEDRSQRRLARRALIGNRGQME